jgi:hypothetical protein
MVNKKSLNMQIDEAFALEEAGKLEDDLRKWKGIHALGDTPYAALQHCRLPKKLGLWDEWKRRVSQVFNWTPRTPTFTSTLAQLTCARETTRWRNRTSAKR